MCFQDLAGVPRELPQVQPDKRASHGGYTTEEIAGGYVHPNPCGSYMTFVVAADGPDALKMQNKVYNYSSIPYACFPNQLHNSLVVSAVRFTDQPNRFKVQGGDLLFVNPFDKDKPPTKVILRNNCNMCGLCGPTEFPRTDWHRPGGPCGAPDWPVMPKGELMFRT